MVDNFQPLFYRERKAFIKAIPSLPIANKSEEFQQLLASYLTHYHIDFVQEKIAKTHVIWQTHIGGYQIIQHRWEAPHYKKNPTDSINAPPKGTIIICHGYMDHTGLYGQLITWALRQHYNVMSFDLPGHGLSSGAPAAIDNFSDYTNIFAHIVENIYLSSQCNNTQPALLYAIGQSTGCAIIVDYCLRQRGQTPGQPLHGVTLMAPLVRSLGWPIMRWIYFICRPILPSIKRRFVRSSHNSHFNHFLKYYDPLQTRRIPLSWLGAMESWYQKLRSLPIPTTAKEHYPMTIIQGTGDKTVDWHYNLPLLRQHFPDSHIHYVPNAKHHMVNENESYWLMIEQHLLGTIDHSKANT